MTQQSPSTARSPHAFVIGHPIAHSRSPAIHAYWLAHYGIAGRYSPLDLTEHQLPGFFDSVRDGAYIGGNITIPHKQAVISLCDEVDPQAREIGAVNTIVCQNGRIVGRNTDQSGFLSNLDDKASGWDTQKGPAIVLGAGGAARAILVGLRERGFAPIHILNRTAETAHKLATELAGPFEGHRLTAFDEIASGARLVVNTTAIGMHGTAFDHLDLLELPPDALVTDIVYTPLETPLLKDARSRGLKTVDGLGMLLHQAAPGFHAWFGQKPDVTPGLRQHIEALLETK